MVKIKCIIIINIIIIIVNTIIVIIIIIIKINIIVIIFEFTISSFIFYLVTFCFSSIVQRLFMVSLARFISLANPFHVASSTTSEWWWPSIALRMIESSSSLKWPFFNSFVVTLTDGLMFSTKESSIVFFGWTSSRSPVNLPRLSSSL